MLNLTARQVRNLKRSGALVSIGRGHQQKVTTDSIKDYRLRTPEKRKSRLCEWDEMPHTRISSMTKTMEKRPSVLDLRKRRQELLSALRKAELEIDDLRREKEFDETNALVEDREPSAKLAKRLSDRELAVASMREKIAPLERAIQMLQETEEQDNAKRVYELSEAFREKAAPRIKQMKKAIADVQKATAEFFDLYSAEQNVQIVDLASFLFPPDPSANVFEDMARRFADINVMNAAVSGITNAGRSGAAGL